MLKNTRMQKMLAVLALVGVVGTTSFTSVSYAATPYRPQYRQVSRTTTRTVVRDYDRHRDYRPAPMHNEYRRRPEPAYWHRDHDSHSDTGNLVTGLIIGGVIGAVIAANS